LTSAETAPIVKRVIVNREPFRHQSLRAVRDVARPAAAPDCFADEIAIDFPSVDHAVERMRDAFVREDSAVDVLAAELQLSTREARLGLTVPLDVPMPHACPTCSGRGGTWRERCDRCSGTGEWLYHHHVRVSLPPGVADGARFRFRVTSPHADASVRVEVRVAVRSSAA
jgi:hypothetical protein